MHAEHQRGARALQAVVKVEPQADAQRGQRGQRRQRELRAPPAPRVDPKLQVLQPGQLRQPPQPGRVPGPGVDGEGAEVWEGGRLRQRLGQQAQVAGAPGEGLQRLRAVCFRAGQRPPAVRAGSKKGEASCTNSAQ